MGGIMRKALLYLGVLAIACTPFMSFAAPGPMAASGPENQQATAAAASDTEAKVGLGIEKLDLTGASDTFKVAPDTRIYGWARVKGVEPGSNVSLVFNKGDKEIYKKEVAIPSVPYRINAYRTFRSGDSGDWKLSIVGPDGKELASTAFKVEVSQ